MNEERIISVSLINLKSCCAHSSYYILARALPKPNFGSLTDAGMIISKQRNKLKNEISVCVIDSMSCFTHSSL